MFSNTKIKIAAILILSLNIIASGDGKSFKTHDRSYKYWKGEGTTIPLYIFYDDDEHFLLKSSMQSAIAHNNRVLNGETENVFWFDKKMSMGNLYCEVSQACAYSWFEEVMSFVDNKNIIDLIKYIHFNRSREIESMNATVGFGLTQEKWKRSIAYLEETNIILQALHDILSLRNGIDIKSITDLDVSKSFKTDDRSDKYWKGDFFPYYIAEESSWHRKYEMLKRLGSIYAVLKGKADNPINISQEEALFSLYISTLQACGYNWFEEVMLCLDDKDIMMLMTYIQYNRDEALSDNYKIIPAYIKDGTQKIALEQYDIALSALNDILDQREMNKQDKSQPLSRGSSLENKQNQE